MVSATPISTQEPTTAQEVIQSISDKLLVTGNEVGQQLQGLIRQANARRLIIKDNDGQVLVQVPLTLGLLGGLSTILLMPPKRVILIAVAALFARLYLVIEDNE